MKQEEMMLNTLRGDIQVLNSNTLYLCKHITNCETRLENIEKNMIISNKVNKIEGKLIAVSMFITITISCVISLLL